MTVLDHEVKRRPVVPVDRYALPGVELTRAKLPDVALPPQLLVQFQSDHCLLSHDFFDIL